jgi:DegV family protein with EDD domain
MDQRSSHRVAIVTDSTCDIPAELVEEYGIHIVPQVLIMGEKSWRDRVDIDPPSFYELLQSSSDFPSTSQPSVASFHELFVEIAQETDQIAAILVSDELSGTVNSAQTAATSLPDLSIEVIDSRAVSMQLGLIVLEAARAAAAGQDLQAVAKVTRGLMAKTYVYFLVDTLEYLHRGGRIGAAARLFGSALNLKPVLEVNDGVVTPLARIRTRRKALRKLYELVEEKLAGEGRVHMAVLNIAAPDEAARVAEQLEARFQPVEMFNAQCSPVVGAHAGPGTVGVAFYKE